MAQEGCRGGEAASGGKEFQVRRTRAWPSPVPGFPPASSLPVLKFVPSPGPLLPPWFRPRPQSPGFPSSLAHLPPTCPQISPQSGLAGPLPFYQLLKPQWTEPKFHSVALGDLPAPPPSQSRPLSLICLAPPNPYPVYAPSHRGWRERFSGRRKPPTLTPGWLHGSWGSVGMDGTAPPSHCVPQPDKLLLITEHSARASPPPGRFRQGPGRVVCSQGVLCMPAALPSAHWGVHVYCLPHQPGIFSKAEARLSPEPNTQQV